MINDNSSLEVKPRSLSFYVILAAALYGFIKAYWLLSPILLAFLLTMLISFALNPIIFWMRKWVKSRKLAAGLLMGGFVTLIFLSILVFAGPMRTSVANLTERLPEYWERIQKPLIKIEQKALLTEEKLQAEVSEDIARDDPEIGAPRKVDTTESSKPTEESGGVRANLTGMFQGVLGSFSAVAFNAAQIVIVLVTVFFGVLFMLMNPRPVLGAIFSLVPERHHGQAQVIMERIGYFAPKWAGAVLLDMASIGLLVFLFMWLIFGFIDALVLGLFAGFMGVVPFLGPFLSAMPALLLALGIGGMTPVWVLFAYIVIQGLQSNLIEPFIMARGMRLHPLAVVFSMLLSVISFGVVGVLVAAPLVAIVQILHEELYRKRYLPNVSDEYLDDMARRALHEED